MAVIEAAADLKVAGVRGSIIDLARDRQDGYDLTDWLNARADLTGAQLRQALGALGAPASGEVA